MSQLDPTLDPALELALERPPQRVGGRRRLRIPGWLALLLRNPKSCTGLAMVGFVLIIALIAPLISVAHPTDFNLFDTRQAPSWHHLFGTTDQGSDIFSQVVLGARRSLLLGAAAGALATGVAAILGITAALVGGIFDDIVNFLISVFLTIPAIPLLVVASGYLKTRGTQTMIVVLAIGAIVAGLFKSGPAASIAVTRKVYPTDIGARGGASAPPPILLEQDRDYRLELVFTPDREYREYRLVFLDLGSAPARSLWSRDHEHPEQPGVYAVPLSTKKLPPGLYELVLYGLDDGEAEHLATFAIRVSS